MTGFKTTIIILIVVLLILVGIIVALYFLGKKAQAKQAEQQVQIDAMKQTVAMLIIDKKRCKLKESGLPDIVIKQTPWYLRFQKIPVVKAKAGPQIVTLVCDEKIFDTVPIRKEVKATVSGMYLTGVKGIHGKLNTNTTSKKKGFFKQIVEKAQEKAGAKPIK